MSKNSSSTGRGIQWRKQVSSRTVASMFLWKKKEPFKMWVDHSRASQCPEEGMCRGQNGFLHCISFKESIAEVQISLQLTSSALLLLLLCDTEWTCQGKGWDTMYGRGSSSRANRTPIWKRTGECEGQTVNHKQPHHCRCKVIIIFEYTVSLSHLLGLLIL